MTLGLQRGKVQLVPYEPEWATIYAQEAQRIKKAFGDKLLGIEHIGSTAIPGMDAKPILDLMVAVASINGYDEYTKMLQKLNYEFRRDNRNEQGHILYVKGPEENRTHYLKLTTTNSEFWNEHVLFRDYLLHHPERAKAYQDLKQALLGKHSEDRTLYTDGKAKFIQETIGMAKKEFQHLLR